MLITPKQVREKRQNEGLSLRSLALELDCAFSAIARFERTGKVGSHIMHKLNIWFYSEQIFTPCPCYVCKRALNHSEKTWEKIKERVKELVKEEIEEYYYRQQRNRPLSSIWIGNRGEY